MAKKNKKIEQELNSVVLFYIKQGDASWLSAFLKTLHQIWSPYKHLTSPPAYSDIYNITAELSLLSQLIQNFYQSPHCLVVIRRSDMHDVFKLNPRIHFTPKSLCSKKLRISSIKRIIHSNLHQREIRNFDGLCLVQLGDSLKVSPIFIFIFIFVKTCN